MEEIENTNKTEKLKYSKNTLEKLKSQRQKLDARIQATETRLKVIDRKKDTRRKILLGAYYLDQARKENTMDTLKALMKNYLTRESDRALFNIEIIEKEEKEEKETLSF